MQQHVVIIGGTSGIGLAAAQILLREKFKVTISGRDPQRLASAGKKLRNEAGTVAVDVTMDSHRNYYNVIHAQAGDVGLDFYIQGR